MTEAEARQALADALARIAPEADLADLGPDDNLREQLDLDSMDFLNLVVELHDRTGIDIREEDYAALRTLYDWLAYLRRPGPPLTSRRRR